MITEVKVFEPTIEGINANNYPSTKEGNMRIALHSEKWNNFEKFFTATCPGIIRNFPVTFNISLAYFEGCKNVFILSIDYSEETSRISNKLPLAGFGQQVYYDFGLAGHHIATQFCRLNKITINYEMSHWPILQYVLERK